VGPQVGQSGWVADGLDIYFRRHSVHTVSVWAPPPNFLTSGTWREKAAGAQS
jgi:hypothetical protein